MNVKRQLILVPGLILSLNCMALNLANVNDRPSTNSIYDSRSCNELYAQASALEQDTYIYRNDFYSDKGTQVATYAMTVFTPAVYYFGYKVYKDYETNVRSAHAQNEMDQVRMRMAEKRCFEKH